MIFGLLLLAVGLVVCLGIYRLMLDRDPAPDNLQAGLQADLDAATAELLREDAAYREGLRSHSRQLYLTHEVWGGDRFGAHR